MHEEPRDTPAEDADSSDVVTGPIGSARLVEPTTAGALGADLDALPNLAVDETSSAAERPTDR